MRLRKIFLKKGNPGAFRIGNNSPKLSESVAKQNRISERQHLTLNDSFLRRRRRRRLHKKLMHFQTQTITDY